MTTTSKLRASTVKQIAVAADKRVKQLIKEDHKASQDCVWSLPAKWPPPKPSGRPLSLDRKWTVGPGMTLKLWVEAKKDWCDGWDGALSVEREVGPVQSEDWSKKPLTSLIQRRSVMVFGAKGYRRAIAALVAAGRAAGFIADPEGHEGHE